VELLVAGVALVGLVGVTGYGAVRRFSLWPSLKSGSILDDLSMDDVTSELDHGRGGD
jgi:hypothetical protein